MKDKKLLCWITILIFMCLSLSTVSTGQEARKALTDEQKILQIMHSISSHKLYDYVKELASDKYEGRLTGTAAYNASADWVASHFEEWDIVPAGDDGTYLQAFPIPYTLVFEDCEVSLHAPYKESSIKKYYRYFDEFVPGSTSGSGEVTAEVVYVGYGITAPELGYDEYEGVDVKGKIMLWISENRRFWR